MSESRQDTKEPQCVSADVWSLWVRTYGLEGARRLAESGGLAPPVSEEASR